MQSNGEIVQVKRRGESTSIVPSFTDATAMPANTAIDRPRLGIDQRYIAAAATQGRAPSLAAHA